MFDKIEATQSPKPSSIIVPGFVYTDWGRREHFWLKDQSGEVVDPTASQFNIILEYEEWKPGMSVKVGRCMNCGQDIFFEPQSLGEDRDIDRSICSDRCRAEFLAHLNEACSSKLTEPEVLRIKVLVKQGVSSMQIADTFGVTQSAIYAIKNGKSWTHLK